MNVRHEWFELGEPAPAGEELGHHEALIPELEETSIDFFVLQCCWNAVELVNLTVGYHRRSSFEDWSRRQMV